MRRSNLEKRRANDLRVLRKLPREKPYRGGGEEEGEKEGAESMVSDKVVGGRKTPRKKIKKTLLRKKKLVEVF